MDLLDETQAKAFDLIRDWAEGGRDGLRGPLIGSSVDEGVNSGRVDGQMFDAIYYARAAKKAGFVLKTEEDPMLHWARYGTVARIVPTPDYHEKFYLAANPDVAATGMFGFLHYLEYGLSEGRSPRPDAPAINKLLREVNLLTADDIRTGTFVMRPGVVSEYAVLLRLLFSPALYLEGSNINASDSEAFELFLAGDLDGDRPFSPLFDALVYAERARRAGFPSFPAKDALRHWLSFGLRTRIAPTGLFDEDYYLSMNSDAAKSHMLGFIHWIYFGYNEGRLPNGWISASGSRIFAALKLGTPLFGAGDNYTQIEKLFPSFHRAMPTRSHSRSFFTDVIGRLKYFVPTFDESHAEILVRIFIPAYYAQVAGFDSEDDDGDLLYHFLSVGMWAGLSPSPLFDFDYYADILDDRDGPTEELPLFLHWLAVGRPLGITPTFRFDADYYRSIHNDVPMNKNAFEHFAIDGIWEGRTPNPLFSPRWYSEHNNLKARPNLPAYINFLINGANQGGFSSLLTSALSFKGDTPVGLHQFDVAVQMLARLSADFTGHQIDVAMHLFVGADVSKAGDEWKEFIGFLNTLLEGGGYSGPLFEEPIYRRRAAAAGFPVADDQSAVIHFLQIGLAARIVPTRLFDEAYYLAANNDLKGAQVWLFEHFVRHGVFEGRRANRMPTVMVAPIISKRSIPQGALVRARFWQGWIGIGLDKGESASGANSGRIARILSSDLMALVMERARALEPQVGDIHGVSSIVVPPYHDMISILDKELRSRFKRKHYDTIICIPWIRTGGADLVACQVAETIRELRDDEQVLLLQIDQPHMERPDWAPERVDIVDISDLTAMGGSDMIERLLYSAFAGLAPRRIINVNSRFCWTTYVRFGKRLAADIDLYAYLFCWDHTSEGFRAGYPSDFFAGTIEVLTALFTDTQYLKDELSRIYMLSDNIANRIIPLFSPARSASWDVTAAEMGAISASTRDRPTILWAGRLDRQKRFDLVLQIAAEMPDADFLCWGSALLDQAPDLSKMPTNITLRNSFQDMDDLPLGESDVWLFTSEWEGLPTILIELANRGMPIVASSVGGVPELILPYTGWLIDDIEQVGLYVSALRSAISSPNERIERGRRLRDRARSRHSAASYCVALDDAFKTKGRI